MDPRLDENESSWRGRAREAAEPLRAGAAGIDADDATPRDLLAALGAAGMLGVSVPEPHGAGADQVVATLVCEELGAASAAAASIVAGHLAAAALVSACGGDAADDLLPALAGGDQLAALVLDGAVSLLEEPAVAISATIDGDAAVLEGEARAVTGGTVAELLVVPVRAGEDAATAVCVVERGADGVTTDPSERKLGLNGSGMGAVRFQDARARVLAGDDVQGALEATRDLLRICHAALAVGIGRAALEAATRHVGASEEALDRSQEVQWMVADMATETEAARLSTWYAATRTDAAELREAAAMARLLAAEAAVGASRRAIQIMGPAGNRASSGVERLYRDAKAMEVHHGAVEAQRVAVARQLLPDLFEDAPAG